MKKFFSFIALAILMVLPLNAHASTKISTSCDSVDAQGYRTCKVLADTTEYSATVKLTEQGGASISNISDGDWTVSNSSNENSTWTVEVSGTDTGEITLFNFTYKVSGETDCKIIVTLGSQTVEVTENTPTENIQTGSTLPYIALGTIAIVAISVYVSTKNKTKMYKI